MVDPEVLAYRPIEESALAAAREAFTAGLQERLRHRSIRTDEVVILEFVGRAAVDDDGWTLLRSSQGDTWYFRERFDSGEIERVAFDFGDAVGGDHWLQTDGTWSE